MYNYFVIFGKNVKYKTFQLFMSEFKNINVQVESEFKVKFVSN